ncbi:MAG: rubrerythrin family protein [Deltaproteobacteria bacterium]|jgi:rubrerythrin|nr:rubrerythrin family protein [Deltaproteobacteria bacterium]MBT4267768.1 rubrerythrin family protein [Deltaproteobacteria bacterium]MBT4644584.1 rubrerythrin family protein [Deltaproteobacteria bacterium]MBT6499839.1 rubrerythrin family protein [Deltaproteobacteria bacterium]MBT7151507.1 rubrerythrin family protein [Deltaproteobacteria bacterium]
MKSLKGTETEKNLLASFAGESQARNRYTYYASKAKKEGYVQISAIFTETADHEKAHAKTFFKFLQGGDVEVTATFPAGVIGSTEENLAAAAAGENHEWTVLYKEAAEVADQEGFDEVAEIFRRISMVEEQHEQRYRKLLQNIKDGKVFERDTSRKWMCRNCGYVHEGKTALNMCPACQHPLAHFEIKKENY